MFGFFGWFFWLVFLVGFMVVGFLVFIDLLIN